MLGAVSLDFERLKYNYSHAEIEFIEDKICFSSTTRGDWHGTRFAPSSEVLKHPDRWDYIEVIIDDWQYAKMLGLAHAEEGREYDYKGIGGFFWFYNTEDTQKWYCSEIVAYLAEAVSLIFVSEKGEYRISPRRLASVLVKKYGKVEPMVIIKKA